MGTTEKAEFDNPMTLNQLATLAGYDDEERKVLRYAERHLCKDDAFVARLIKSIRRDLEHYRVLHSHVLSLALEKSTNTSDFSSAVKERNDWVECIDNKVKILMEHPQKKPD